MSSRRQSNVTTLMLLWSGRKDLWKKIGTCMKKLFCIYKYARVRDTSILMWQIWLICIILQWTYIVLYIPASGAMAARNARWLSLYQPTSILYTVGSWTVSRDMQDIHPPPPPTLPLTVNSITLSPHIQRYTKSLNVLFYVNHIPVCRVCDSNRNLTVPKTFN